MTTLTIPKDKVDLETLGLINQGLFHVDKELAIRYNNVLKHVFDLESDIDSFRIDKRGLSPEVGLYLQKKYPERFEYPDNYLNMRSANRFMIVVSPDQKSAPLIAKQTTYEDELYDSTYKNARHTIEDVTASEALVGEIENHISVFRTAYDLLRMRDIEISLDTLQGTVKSIQELKRLSDDLGKENNALDENYISKMKDIVAKVGDIRNRAISNIFPIKREVHCFGVEFFKGVYCLRNFRNKDDIRGIFITNNQPDDHDLGKEIAHYDLRSENLLEDLHKYKFVKYNSDLIERRLEEIEDDVLLSKKIDLVDLNGFQKKGLVHQHIAHYPESWHELRDIERLLENTSDKIKELVETKSYATRLKLSEPASKDEIIDRMLAELDSTDIVRSYEWSRRNFVRQFPSLPLNRQRYYAYKILSNMKGGNN